MVLSLYIYAYTKGFSEQRSRLGIMCLFQDIHPCRVEQTRRLWKCEVILLDMLNTYLYLWQTAAALLPIRDLFTIGEGTIDRSHSTFRPALLHCSTHTILENSLYQPVHRECMRLRVAP